MTTMNISDNVELVKFWHKEKNLPIMPEQVSCGSKKQYWWVCDEVHEFELSARSMSSAINCRVCSGRILVTGVNDLESKYPELAKEWHSKNELLPFEVSFNSSKTYWWICNKDHEWEAKVSVRVKGHGCGQCAELVDEFDSFGSLFPVLSEQWHPEKNPCSPFEVAHGSRKKFWWICGKGHEWEAAPGYLKRTTANGCPTCARKKVDVGVNDFVTLYPELVERLHNADNVDFSNISVDSSKRFTWKCNKEHTYESSIASKIKTPSCRICRQSGKKFISDLPSLCSEWSAKNNIPAFEVTKGMTSKFIWECKDGHEWKVAPNSRRNAGCPVCSNYKVVKGINDLVTTHPQLAKEWHPTKNESLSPYEVSAGAAKKVWWICDQGHEWKTNLYSRSQAKRGCGICSGNVVNPGVNDLVTLYPEISREWSELNSLEPSKVSAGSNAKYLWECQKGHTFKSSPAKRTRRGTAGCAICANQELLEGYNDLETLHPDIVKEFDIEKNNIKPKEVIGGGKITWWWKCEKDHQWRISIDNRIDRKTNKGYYGCISCNSGEQASKAELEIGDYIESLGLEVERSNRTLIKPLEVDIYVPSKNVAVEFNGLYWHSEEHKEKGYHYDKWKACYDVGVQLIQVWEDDWLFKSFQVKSMLASKLGASSAIKVGARKTRVVESSFDIVGEFLDVNHIQGRASGSLYFGLEHDSALVAVMVLKKRSEGVWELVRYAASCNVQGGFSKLLKYFESNFCWSEIVTFADLCVSDGGLYKDNGFIMDKLLKPDYSYFVGGVCEHKFGYRLKRFENDPDLIWEDGLSERELAELNGLLRIYDAGKQRWVKNF